MRQPRKEQRPEPTQSKSTTKPEVPLGDPGYHYRIVSKEDETAERSDYHKELGYGVAHESQRQLVMACKKDEHEKRQERARERANRLRESALPHAEGLVQDETSVEVRRGLRTDD